MLKFYVFTEESAPQTQVERRKTSPYFSSKYSKGGTVFFREIHFLWGRDRMAQDQVVMWKIPCSLTLAAAVPVGLCPLQPCKGCVGTAMAPSVHSASTKINLLQKSSF